MQVEGPFADKEGLEKSSSDGLVKELLIWQHRALILLSPSHGIPISISGTSKKVTQRGGGNKVMRRIEQRDKQTERIEEKIIIQLCNRPS